MTPDKTLALIDQRIAYFMNTSRFGMSAVQHHIHNNVDSPKVSYNDLRDVPVNGIYSGNITSGGTASPLPTGWSVVKNSTGNYTVTHNLNTTNYGVGATCYTNDPGTFRAFAVLTDLSSNSFTIGMYSTSATGVGAAVSFVLYIQN